MAAKDTQTYQLVAVFAFVAAVLSLGLAILFYQMYSKAAEETATAKNDASTAQDALRTLNSDMSEVQGWFGVSGDVDSLDAVRKDFAQQTGLGGDGLDSVTFLQVFDTLKEGKNTAEALLKRQRDQNASLQADFNAAQQKFQADLTAAETAAQKAGEELQAAKDEIARYRDDINAKLDVRVAERDDIKQKLEADVARLESELKTAEESLRQLQTRFNELNEIVNRSRPDNFDPPDGKIMSVFPYTKTVWINLGREDGLTKQTSFSIFGPNAQNVGSAERKGAIRVTKLQDNLAECVIVDDNLANPISRGDEIYSPIWHPGRRQGFAIAGKVDFDGDGVADLSRLQRLIEQSGGQVDAVVDETGASPAGKGPGDMTINTRYLILGDQPVVTSSEDKDAVAKYTAIRNAARDLGVSVISVDKFLDLVGYPSGRKRVTYGRDSEPNRNPSGDEASPTDSLGGGRRGLYARPF